MYLVINTPGSYISRNGECLKIKGPDKTVEVSVNKINSVIITTGAAITTDAINLCLEKNVDIVFLDDYGEPIGRLWFPKLSGTNLIRRIQLLISESEQGTSLALLWILNKFEARIKFLKELRDRRPQKSSHLTKAIKDIKESMDKLREVQGKPDTVRGHIMGIEGNAGKSYFNVISLLMPQEFKFSGRSSRPAKDRFNAALNYAYGLLYSLVERSCLISGLDPCIGILHTDDYNKKSLVFDIIERYKKANVKRKNIIEMNAHSLANYLIKTYGDK